MKDIIIGEKVINKLRQHGTIVSFDDAYIYVDYGNRTAKLQLNAFELGFLRYEKADIQSNIDEKRQQVQNEKDQEAERKRLLEEKHLKMRKMMEAQAPAGTKFNSVSIRLEPAPISLNSVKNKHKATVQEIFDACDKDINTFYDHFHPTMRYVVPRRYSYNDRGQLRSRYAVGFVTNYSGTYVLRVFSRNDLYVPSRFGGGTVTNSDTTEILRILCLDGVTYYFSKHLSCEHDKYKNTLSYKRWQASVHVRVAELDEVIKVCDCKYLNDHINVSNVNCFGYAKVLFAALYNNKAEILFKHKMFSSVNDIDNVSDYLKEYTSKQIDFACRNDVFHTLSFLKKFGINDMVLLRQLEGVMLKKRSRKSIYDALVQIFAEHSFDKSVLDERLITFLRKNEYYDETLYYEYLVLLVRDPSITVDDLFDREYDLRHDNMLLEKHVDSSIEAQNRYVQIAQELSWIDREDKGYHIIIPKTIFDFMHEGREQHICVYQMEYFLYVIRKQSIIVFLRQEKDTPYVTIEYDYRTFEVRQARRKYNQKVDSDLYQYIVDLGQQLKSEMLAQE